VFEEDLKRQIEQLHSSMEQSPSYYDLLSLRHHAKSLSGVLLAKRCWEVAQAPTGSFFVLSDSPVTTVEIGPGWAAPGPGFAKQNAVVLVPLSPQSIFIATTAPFSRGSRWKPRGCSIDQPPLGLVRTC
jgi:hypothetical protein